MWVNYSIEIYQRFFNIDINTLPTIKSSSEPYITIKFPHLSTDVKSVNIPVSGCLGDQQAALVGHMCFDEGSTKNT